MEYQEYTGNTTDDPGIRKLSKDRCEEIDWSNKKEITAYEIAYCIVQYELTIDTVQGKRRTSVEKEVSKLKKAIEKESKKKRIESILHYEPDETVCRLLGINYDVNNSGHFFDPDLFANEESAEEAIFMVRSLSSSILNSIMLDGIRYKDKKYNKDFTRARNATLKLFETYEKIGISRSEAAKALNSIEPNKNTTIKQELDSRRENIINIFISLGNSKTNAEKIAKAITLQSEQGIPITSKF